MIILFKLTMLTSILVLGWKIITAEGMLLHNVFVWAEEKSRDNKMYEWITCPFCSPTIFSFGGFGFAYLTHIVQFNNWWMVFYYPLCVAASSIVSGFTWTLYQFINSVKERNELESEALINKVEMEDEDYYPAHN